ncbi:MAG: CDGSH iron-sulfur domain-containing protein [Myxococcales bacterium]|nr:CDGSH iron-sulfur domain-containing protein [Myxococcales bacterium]
MAEAKIARDKPIVDKFEAGEYWWCACGRSQNQPFCDGSHAGTEFQPIRFDLNDEKKLALCCCKMTQTPPFCDGSHSKLKPKKKV